MKKKRTMTLFQALLCGLATMIFLQCTPAYPEESEEMDFDSMSLEEMLDVKITVASKTRLTQRESPGIITVITHDEIINSGARDLVDILFMVPGFMPAADVQNSVGIGIRGSWAHEGKVLLLVDGQEMNETLYSTVQLGNHYPLESISRIEIIRGPGSATYGGFAELGVINIITKSAEEVNGVSVAGAYGWMENAYARRTLSLSFGKEVKDFNFVAHSFFGQGYRSDRNYTDAYGNTFNMEENSDLHPFNLNFGTGYKGLSTRIIVDRFHSYSRDFYDEALDRPLQNDFNSYYFEGRYSIRLGNRLTLTPQFNYKRQTPWMCKSEACIDEEFFYAKTAERFEEKLLLSLDASDKVNLLFGGIFYQDRSHLSDDTPPEYLFETGHTGIPYENSTFLAQGTVKTPWMDVTAGARVEHHSQAGNSFAPRLGLTKVKGRFHFKGLIARAFRAPGIENLFLNPEVEPERTTVMEFEAGYQVTKDSLLTGNVFNSRIHKPIVYSYDSENDVETYENFTETGTRGFELDYRIKNAWGYIVAGYSYYRAIDNQVDYYSIEGDPALLLGFPAHKFTVYGSIRLSGKTSINPTLIAQSARYGYRTPADEETPPEKFDPACLANLNFRWKDFISEGLDLDLGVYDIFGQNFEYIQPYKGSHAPLPGPSREFRVRLGYRWNFKAS